MPDSKPKRMAGIAMFSRSFTCMAPDDLVATVDGDVVNSWKPVSSDHCR